MIRLSWVPNAEVDIASYQIWRSDNAVTYTQVVEITHDLNEPTVYDTGTGRFYYDDATGTTDHWYKVRAVDAAANESGFTVPRQPGPPTPEVCIVHGTVLGADGTPKTDAQVQVYVRNEESTKAGQFVNSYGITASPVEVHTNDAGFWEVGIVRGANVRINIPDVNLDTEISIPDQVSADISTLI